MFQLKNGFIAFLVVILPLLALKTTADANDSPEDIDKNRKSTFG